MATSRDHVEYANADVEIIRVNPNSIIVRTDDDHEHVIGRSLLAYGSDREVSALNAWDLPTTMNISAAKWVLKKEGLY